jgi:glutaredoxin
MTNVVLYTQPSCNPCKQVKRQLTLKGIEFTERDVTQDPEALKDFKALGFTGTPVIQTDDDAWMGFDNDKIEALANA